ncbi:MAG TPA: TIGR01777 family oxidoreductase, partial [Candidatus Dormibacteraeota bacterium]|nr:TIGR01777 family oxidoreductase [Candidatus Dormibacteraeota bacterium]
GRWTKARKELLRASRIDTTRALVYALGKMSARPRVLVSASAIGIYGDRGDEVLTEESKPGTDFLANLAREWETEALKAEALGIRVVLARFGIILAHHGGALAKMLLPFKLGAGGRLGLGKQWMSWITLEDVVGMIRFAIETSAIRRAVDVVAPNAVQNAEFTKVLAKALHRPALFPAPAFALRLALGEMADALLLSSQRVKPQVLEKLGYKFLYSELPGALNAALQSG